MGFAGAGLLAGLGKGIENLGKSIEERRQKALEAARQEAAERAKSEQRQRERAEDRSYAVADRDVEQKNAIARIDAQGTQQGKLQDDRQTHDASEADKDRTFKAAQTKVQQGHEVNMANLGARLAMRKDAASQRLAAEIQSGEVLDSYTTEDGKLALVYKGGRREITDSPGSRASAAASGVDPITGLPTGTPGTVTPPTKGSEPKRDPLLYKPWAETLGYIQQGNPRASKDEIIRQSVLQATKYGLPVPPREMKLAKDKGWIK